MATKKTEKKIRTKKTPKAKKPAAKKISEVKAEPKKEKPKKEAPEKSLQKAKKYFEATGRRKTAVARVRLFTARPFEGEEGKIFVNEKPYKQYFPLMDLQQTVESSLRKLKSLNRFEVAAKVKGGGIRAQAEALRHGIARALIKFNVDFRKKLKRAGYLTRDPRKKERKKYGLKAARRAPQWAKR